MRESIAVILISCKQRFMEDAKGTKLKKYPQVAFEWQVKLLDFDEKHCVTLGWDSACNLSRTKGKLRYDCL